ncbi:MAG TPA: hypothetical protein VD926_08330 [Acidimicrobiales bacterium]|nr:hypothetical protein [Acidimicrobiales bacterium]
MRLSLLVAAGSIALLSACSGEMTASADVEVSGDPACGQAFEDVLGAIGGGLDGMIDAAPEELRPDLRLLVVTYGDVFWAWVETGEGPADGALDTPELDAAEQRVLDWLEQHCAEPAGDTEPGSTTLD